MIKHTESVSVHIRRGDYLSADEVYGGICTEAYYEAAIAHIQKKYPSATFFFFSNETKWARKWLEKRYMKAGEEELDTRYCLIEETTEHTGYLDMMLMSKCKHHILANSSFSWWAAYLHDSPEKIVIAPDRWLGNAENKDIYTDTMVRITAEGIIK
jgi:hypothetical protein